MSALVHAAESPDGTRPLDDAAARLAAAHTVRLAREAIAVVCDGAGASVYFEPLHCSVCSATWRC